MIVPPSRLPGEPDELEAGDTVMVAYLAPPLPGEEACRVVRVELSLVAEAMGFLVVDPAPGETAVEPIAGDRLAA